MTRRALVVAAAVTGPALAAAPGSVPVADAAGSYVRLSPFDHHLLRDINDARASRGLRRLALAAGTTDVAHYWSCHLARLRVVEHNPNLGSMLSTHGSSAWTTYGENVARQPRRYTARHLFRAYMHDPSHRANILDGHFRYVGIWTKRGGHRRYNTTDFVGATLGSYNTSYGATRVTC
jgi:uncharacterized protein YkwD